MVISYTAVVVIVVAIGVVIVVIFVVVVAGGGGGGGEEGGLLEPRSFFLLDLIQSLEIAHYSSYTIETGVGGNFRLGKGWG